MLFSAPAADVQARLREVLANHPRIFREDLGGASHMQTTLVQDGVAFLLHWSNEIADLSANKRIFTSVSGGSVRSMLSVGLHENLDGGYRLPPVMETFFALAVELCRLLSPVAVLWKPGKLISDTGYFVETVDDYLSGGVFPVLATVDIEYSDDERAAMSRGLALFAGQEFVLESNIPDRRGLMQRALRLAHDIATKGAIVHSQRTADLLPGKQLQLEADAEGRLLTARIISGTD